jgi:CelD/BcsL family acetyltransferase involved in cellulose biosynthesis
VTHAAQWELQTVRTIAELEALRSEWNGFLGDVTDACGLHDSTYFTALLHREGSEPLVVVVRNNGVIKAIAPFIHCSEAVPLRLSLIKLGEISLPRLRLVGDDFSIAGDVDANDVYRRVFAELPRATNVAVVEAQEIAADGRFCKCVDTDVLRSTKWSRSPTPDSQICHTIRFPQGFPEYMDALKSRDRTNLRRRHKKLAEFFDGDLKLVRISATEQIDTFLSTLDEICSNTWQSQVYGRRTRNTERERRFFASLVELGWLRSYLLFGKEQSLAFQFGIRYRGRYDFLETGYDAKWSHLGPGTVLEYLVLEDLLSSDRPELGDFGFGDAEYKRILANSTHLEFERVYLRRRWSVKPTLAFGAQRLMDASENGIRKFLKVTRSDRIVRRMLRRRRKGSEA